MPLFRFIFFVFDSRLHNTWPAGMTQSLSTMLHVELEVLRKHANFADCFSKMVGDTHVHLAALYSGNSRGAHRLEVSKF